MTKEVLGKVRCSRKVSEVAKKHDINEMTVCNWLERDTAACASKILEASRLRRENESLLRLIGQLMYESGQQKKNQRRAGR